MEQPENNPPHPPICCKNGPLYKDIWRLTARGDFSIWLGRRQEEGEKRGRRYVSKQGTDLLHPDPIGALTPSLEIHRVCQKTSDWKQPQDEENASADTLPLRTVKIRPGLD